ncbi:MAG: folate family ECF transporter S component [Clostridia bacterium]|nr:folate family ECF transporter S component [Clostridia bacterium]
MSVFNGKKGLFSVRTLTSCAVLIAVTVVLSRFLVLTPTESSRYSIEAVPIFLSGMLFGPVAGAFVGFAADFIGCLFSPFGYNPIFSLPPVLYGLCAGLFGRWLMKNKSFFAIALAFACPIILGSVLWQSFALSLVYGGESRAAYFTATIIGRGIQFAVMWLVDTLLIWLLLRSALLASAGLLSNKRKH